VRASGFERRLLLGVVGVFLLPAAVVEAVLIMLYRAGVFPDTFALLLAVLVGLAVLMVFLAWVAHTLGRALVDTLETIRHGAELMASVNADHRVEIRTGDEFEALARDINRLADRGRDARVDLEAHVAVATHTVEEERAKLAAVLSELSEGVVVATLDGRVSLANRAARELLTGGSGFLGRSLFELIDRESIASRLDRLRAGTGSPEWFTLALPRQPGVWASMAAFRDGEGTLTGFLLALRAPTGDGAEARFPEPSRPSERFLVGAGLRSGVEGGTPNLPRPQLYDFSPFAEARGRVLAGELERDLSALVFVVFDVETTGLAPESGDRVVSLAGVRVKGGAVRSGEIFDALVRPERAVPPASTRFHGITDAMVAGAPPVDVVLPAFVRFAEGAVLVGHEVSFDLGFLGREAVRLGMEPLSALHPVLDTRLLSRFLHGQNADHSLEAVAGRLGVVIQGRHSALGDALATAEVLVRLLKLLEGRGIRTLGQTLSALRGTR
jgi:DNA polymerase III subunit epsilon